LSPSWDWPWWSPPAKHKQNYFAVETVAENAMAGTGTIDITVAATAGAMGMAHAKDM
jgi:hypothetical protein